MPLKLLLARHAALLAVAAAALAPASARAATTWHVTTAGDPASGTSCPSAIQWGSSREYARETSLKTAAKGDRTLRVRAVLRGLKPGHVYHYRLVAVSSSGRTVGPDMTFTTKPAR